jgi:ribokinase
VSPKRIIVIGDAMLDVVVKPTAARAPTSDTPSSVRISRGGAGANVAVALANFGHEVIYVGAVGDDMAGHLFVDELVRAGVTPHLGVADGLTGVVVALIADDGQRAMMTDRGVNAQLEWEAVRLVLEQPFEHLHLSGYTLLDEKTRSTGVSALELARSKGATSSVDVCSVGPLARVTVPVFLAAAQGASMLFANAEEARMLTGMTDVREAAVVLGRSFAEVLVTIGARGAVAVVKGEMTNEGSRGTKVLDSTGAGDAASGTYLATRVGGGSVRDSLVAAMGAAAIVVRGLGARG